MNNSKAETVKQEKSAEHKFYDTYNERPRAIFKMIDSSVKACGWKFFVMAVLEYQSKLIKSHYIIFKSWK